MSDVTHILSQIQSGDTNAASELLPLVYDELRKLAAARMAHENLGQTLQVDSDEERSRYLDQVCRADTSVRARVESLVRAHFEERKFLGGPSAQDSKTDTPLVEQPGTQIGPYKLREGHHAVR
ncbi:MAG: hypothetical protein KDB27_07175 [Planctomycetales bacterium]|nr:hypothetical protein [Planctomycetales bacterium]